MKKKIPFLCCIPYTLLTKDGMSLKSMGRAVCILYSDFVGVGWGGVGWDVVGLVECMGSSVNQHPPLIPHSDPQALTDDRNHIVSSEDSIRHTITTSLHCIPSICDLIVISLRSEVHIEV